MTNENFTIDLIKLCGALGYEAIQKMYGLHMINREQFEHVSYMWKQANKETYKIVVKSFNDGNNDFEEIVYINPDDTLDVVYKHTQGGEITLEKVIVSKDKLTAEKILSALNTVQDLRLKFGMECTKIRYAILLLENIT